jgi:hypothetical protein
MLEEKTYLNIFEDKDIAIFVSEEQKMIMHKFASKVSPFRPFIGNHCCKTKYPETTMADYYKDVVVNNHKLDNLSNYLLEQQVAVKQGLLRC